MGLIIARERFVDGNLVKPAPREVETSGLITSSWKGSSTQLDESSTLISVSS